MRILLASGEVHPYSKTGGLADMVAALAKALARAGHRVGLVTPLYAGVRERFPEISRMDWTLDLPLGPQPVHGEVWTLEPVEGLTIYFIHQPDFYFRPSLYQQADGTDFPDNAERFTFLSKAVVQLARYLPWQPELVHVHDWQVGLVPLLIRQQKLDGWTNAPPVCLTIHNLAYQGIFPASQFPLANLPREYFHPDGAEFYGYWSFLKSGIAYADTLTTVSPRYAREITTPEFGCGLDGLLRGRQRDLVGILNGVDYDEWNATHNPFIKHPFTSDDLSGKTAEKLDLQQELGLPVSAKIPLFGSINRLVEQKGVDIQLGALEEMLGTDLQFIQLGTGAPLYEQGYRNLARRYRSKVVAQIGYDHALSHRIEAGCDFFLMPSRFEPCGLNQMYSLRYGTVPVVRITGGLDDSVIDISEDLEGANGIKFREYSSRALAKSIRKALALYSEPELLERYRQNGMAADFSWERTAQQYVETYDRAQTRSALPS